MNSRNHAIVGSIISLCFFVGTELPAETVNHFRDGPNGYYSDVSRLLDNVGIGSGNSASETTATTFVVPGTVGTTRLTFKFQRDTGAFLFEFGLYPVSVVKADPAKDKKLYAVQAIGAAIPVFDDRIHGPGEKKTISLQAGQEIGFFIVPNRTIENFLDNPDNFYPPRGAWASNAAPLFSVSDANPGEFDQVLSFIGNGITLFTFEDLSRNFVAGDDFTDLAFTVNSELSLPNKQPSIEITYPDAEELFPLGSSIEIEAIVHDSDSEIAAVAFLADGLLLEIVTDAPFKTVWTNALAGEHTLTARAQDQLDSVGVSEPVTITVLQNLAPSVRIIDPDSRTAFVHPVSLSLVAEATDPDGTVRVVEFFSDDTKKLGEDFTAPYEILWENVPAGEHRITARVTDDRGATGTAEAVIVFVQDPLVLSIDNVEVREGNIGFTEALLTINLSRSSEQTVMVQWSTIEITATGGIDYMEDMGIMRFPPGRTSRQISVSVTGDLLVEEDEIFAVELSGQVGAVIGQGRGTVTILNDDVDLPTNMAPSLMIDAFENLSIPEDGSSGPIVFMVQDLDTAIEELVVTAVAFNSTLIPETGIILGGIGSLRSMILTPAKDQFGETMVTVTVLDDKSLTAEASIPVTVLPVNDPPTLDVVENVVVTAGETLRVNLSGITTGAENENDNLTVKTTILAGGNFVLVPIEVYTSPESAGFIDVTGISSGAALIEVVVDDGATQLNLVRRQFTVTVVEQSSIRASIVAPLDLQEFGVGEPVPFEIEVLVENVSVSDVQLILGSRTIQEFSAPPYQGMIENLSPGIYQLHAVARGPDGIETTTDVVRFAVGALEGDVAIIPIGDSEQTSLLVEALFEMGYRATVWHQGSFGFRDLSPFQMVIVESVENGAVLAESTVSVLRDLAADFMPMYFIGSTIVSSGSRLPADAQAEWHELLGVQASAGQVSISRVELLGIDRSAHPLFGRGFGIVSSFDGLFIVDSVQISAADQEIAAIGESARGDIPLIVTTPALDQIDSFQRRSVTQLFPVINSDTGVHEQIRNLFMNTVCWVLRSCDCREFTLDLILTEEPNQKYPSGPIVLEYFLEHGGECDAIGAEVVFHLAESMVFLSAQTDLGQVAYNQATHSIAFRYMRLGNNAEPTLSFSVWPNGRGDQSIRTVVTANLIHQASDRGGVVLSVSPMMRITRTSSGEVIVAVDAEVRDKVLILESSDLKFWDSIQPMTPENGELRFPIEDAGSRFFKIFEKD